MSTTRPTGSVTPTPMPYSDHDEPFGQSFPILCNGVFENQMLPYGCPTMPLGPEVTENGGFCVMLPDCVEKEIRLPDSSVNQRWPVADAVMPHGRPSGGIVV